MCQEKFRLDIGKTFCSKGIVRHWRRLPREVMEPPSLELLKRYAHVAAGTWFSGELGSIGLTVGFNALRSLF